MFIALDVSLSLIKTLRPIIQRLERRNPAMAKQLVNAASSVALNLAEGSQRRGKDQPHLYRIAAGSASEARTAVQVSRSLGWLDGLDLREIDELFDRQAAVLYRLLNPKRRG